MNRRLTLFGPISEQEAQPQPDIPEKEKNSTALLEASRGKNDLLSQIFGNWSVETKLWCPDQTRVSSNEDKSHENTREHFTFDRKLSRPIACILVQSYLL